MLNLQEKKELLHKKAQDFSNDFYIDKYESFANEVYSQYHHNNSLSMLSANYEIGRLSDNLKEEALSFSHNKEFLGFLVDKLFQHELFASRLYTFIFRKLDPSVVLSAIDIYLNDNLMERYESLGLGPDALAEMNGELWLNSLHGEEYLS